MALIDSIKNAVRVPSTAIDTDLNELINACKDELIDLGLDNTKVASDDTQITQACKLYVMWRIDYECKGDRYGAMYAEYVNMLRCRVKYLEGDTDV